MKQPLEFYNETLQELTKEVTQLRKRLRTTAISRLLSFLLLVASVFFILPNYLLPGILLAVLSLSTFLFLIKVYLKLRQKVNHTQALIDINKNEIKALGYDYSMFNTGEEFFDPVHPFSYDMDLFGEGSIYQFINRTVTIKGKAYLASLLRNETLEGEAILRRQEAVKELKEKITFTQEFRAKGSFEQDNPEDIEALKGWVGQPAFTIKKRLAIFLIRFMPYIFLGVLVLAILLPGFRTLLLILYLGNLFVTSTKLAQTNKEHGLISKRLDALKKYRSLLDSLEKQRFESKELTRLNQELVQGTMSASTSIHKLTKILSNFDFRLNVVAALLLEGTALWDLQCLYRIQKWKDKQGKHLEAWLDAIAEYDALVSLSTFAFNNPDFNYPSISESVIRAEELGHVLLPADVRVCNPFEIVNDGDFVIVTGANMAGKSTFLRTVATNMILAMSGAPVCARNLEFKPMKLFSSMRTSDSLTKHESYFYAELKRLKEMLDKLKAGEKLFIILDEILKGTNSVDKQRGSYAALKQIVLLTGTGIIATHDLELAKVEEEYPDRVKNMCFEIEIDDAKISFDYKLRAGVTTKMNASLLMEQMGIIPKN